MSKPTEQSHPPWLKAMQNGALGEARSKAFLLDRFWILERSVDIEGADIIIQRRLTNRNLLDRDAPKIGFVQVKFFGTHQTSHYIHKDYVLEPDGSPRDDFFLLCHSGDESAQRAFFLTPKDLVDDFVLKANDDGEKFYVPWNKVGFDGKYEILDRKICLDRIENHLKLADFSSNRRFMSWVLPSVYSELDGILPDFREPLDNWWGDIADGFRDFKEKVRSALIDVEEVYELLASMVEEVDPLKAEAILKKVAYHCKGGRGWYISLPDDLDSYDFFQVCRRQRKMIDQLRGDGVLNAFLKLGVDVAREFMSFLEPHFPVDYDLVHSFEIYYEPESFVLRRIDSKLTLESDFKDPKDNLPEDVRKAINNSGLSTEVWENSKGVVSGSWTPGRYSYTNGDEDESFAAFRDYRFTIFMDCMDRIYVSRYGEEF